MATMSNLDDLIAAARAEQHAIDAEIGELRSQRSAINIQLKALAVRKTRVARVVVASQPRTRRSKVVSDDG